MITDSDFRLTSDVIWTGKCLGSKWGYPFKCIKNIGKYKLYVEKTWYRNGFGCSQKYYVVNTQTNKVYQYVGHIEHNVATRLIQFLKRKV